MPTNEELIGVRFERIVKSIFSELRKNPKTRKKLPDFTTGRFSLEAKTAYVGPSYAARIKEYQVRSFAEHPLPIVYLIGYHDFGDATLRLADRTTRGKRRMLTLNMDV